MKRYYTNKNGSALVFVLLITVIITILGFTLLSIGLAEMKSAEWHESKSQAYYLAQTGADAVATYILKNPDNKTPTELDSFVDQLRSKTSADTPYGNGSFKVKVEPNGTDLYIQSTGTVNNVSQTVTAIIKRRGVFDNAIYADTSLTLWSGAKVYGGDVQYGEYFSKGNNAEIIDGSAFKEKTDFPENQFPNPSLPNESDMILSNHEHRVIDLHSEHPVNENLIEKSYDVIDVPGNASLTIKLHGQTKRLVVRQMNVKGTLRIEDECEDGCEGEGEGKLLLYVKEAVYFKGFVESQAKNLIVYIGDLSESNPTGSAGYMELKTGNSIFNGYIIGIHAKIDVTANLVYTGAIIADTVNVASNAEVHYDVANAPLIIPSEINLPPLGYKFVRWE